MEVLRSQCKSRFQFSSWSRTKLYNLAQCGIKLYNVAQSCTTLHNGAQLCTKLYNVSQRCTMMHNGAQRCHHSFCPLCPTAWRNNTSHAITHCPIMFGAFGHCHVGQRKIQAQRAPADFPAVFFILALALTNTPQLSRAIDKEDPQTSCIKIFCRCWCICNVSASSSW